MSIETLIVAYLCPKLLNSQSMFWKSNFHLGMSKHFVQWKWFRRLSSVVKSCFWFIPKSFGSPKIKLDFQNINLKFKSLGHTTWLLCITRTRFGHDRSILSLFLLYILPRQNKSFIYLV